jgi:hypothetical protein
MLGFYSVLIRQQILLWIVRLELFSEGTCSVWASDPAVSATHALVVVYYDDPVITLETGTGGTHIHAGWFFTVHTEHRYVHPPDIWKLAELLTQDFAPEHADWGSVLSSAGYGARIATNASFEIYDHSISGHCFLPP